MKKAIHTKTLPPTDRHGRRVKAFDADGNSTTVAVDDIEFDEQHRAAAVALSVKMNWPTDGLVEGYLKDGERVFVEDDVRAALVAALERLTIVCEGAGWLRRPGDPIEQARAALALAGKGV